jgi:hypothetical protein
LARTILILLLSSVLCTAIYSQDGRKTNIEVFDNIITAGLEKFMYYPGLNRNFEFIFIVNPVESGGSSKRADDINRYLSSIIKKTASSNKLNFSIAQDTFSVSKDSGYNAVALQVFELETKYTGFKKNKFLGEKTLERNIKVNIGVNITSASGFSLSDKILSDYKDEVKYDDSENLEASQYSFTHAVVPKISSFETIVFPVLLIVVSAAATILFFTIRSK